MTRRHLPVLSKDLATLEDRLAAGKALDLHPRPEALAADDPRDAKLQEQRLGTDPIEEFVEQELAHGRLRIDLGVGEEFALRAHLFHYQSNAFDQQNSGDETEIARNTGDHQRLEDDHADDRERFRADRLANADLSRSLLDDDQHDVRDADHARDDRADRNEPAEAADTLEDPLHLAKLAFDVDALQRLRIGVGTDEIHSLYTGVHHVLDRVAAASTDAQYFNNGVLAVTIHELKHVLVSSRQQHL